jgi:acetate kinase
MTFNINFPHLITAMQAPHESILVINSGSSSIKFSFFPVADLKKRLLYGELEKGGLRPATLHVTNASTGEQNSLPAGPDGDGINFLLDWFEKQSGFVCVAAIGHRIVHGMSHTQPEKITPELLDELKKISAYDPEHLPSEIELITRCQANYPGVLQVACFDTSFHRSMPVLAKMLPIPRKYFASGVQRYGFHGLSYAYLMEELGKLQGSLTGNEKIILAHLGNGASLAAIREGRSIDTSMGFTPTGGIPMSTRTGDLDPGVAGYLIKEEKLSPEQFSHLVNHESGLAGISETSSDMRELLKIRATDKRAAEAIGIFCYQARKCVGAFAAALGGVDILVFSGGIGENAPEIREGICSNLQFIGITLDKKRNDHNEAIISGEDSRVIVRVIKTDEELMIARLVSGILDAPSKT